MDILQLRRRVWALICFAGLVLLSGAWQQSTGADPPSGPANILLIFADDVGSDAIGCYGGQSYPTPNVDALAATGMKFNHAYAMPVCHPSRICLMTGSYPFRFGKSGTTWGKYPSAAEKNSIAHRLKQGGYTTAVAGKWQLCMMKNDLDHPARCGFDEWCLFGWHEGARYHDPLIYQNGKLRQDTKGKYGPDLYTEFLIDFMKRQHAAERPFFAYYPMALCHDVTDDLKGKTVPFFQDGRWMSFAEMMGSMDDRVGRLMQALEEMDARKDTLVLFTTDNGTAGRSYSSVDRRGKMTRTKVVSVRNGVVVPGGKGKTDDTGTRVPLIANWPGQITPGSKTDVMVDLTDLLPTLAEIADCPPDSTKRDGVSYAETLLGRTDRSKTRDWIYIDHRGARCVRSKSWKLYADGRFYNVAKDPTETRSMNVESLDPEPRKKYEELKQALANLKK